MNDKKKNQENERRECSQSEARTELSNSSGSTTEAQEGQSRHNSTGDTDIPHNISLVSPLSPEDPDYRRVYKEPSDGRILWRLRALLDKMAAHAGVDSSE